MVQNERTCVNGAVPEHMVSVAPSLGMIFIGRGVDPTRKGMLALRMRGDLTYNYARQPNLEAAGGVFCCQGDCGRCSRREILFMQVCTTLRKHMHIDETRTVTRMGIIRI